LANCLRGPDEMASRAGFGPRVIVWRPLAYTSGGEPIYYHGPHELCVIAGGPQIQLILS